MLIGRTYSTQESARCLYAIDLRIIHRQAIDLRRPDTLRIPVLSILYHSIREIALASTDLIENGVQPELRDLLLKTRSDQA